MKKKLIILVLAVISSVACAFGFAACGGGSKQTHTHTYSEEWSSDKDNHWHIANCEHTEEKSDLAPHIDANNNGECDVCLYRPMTVSVGGTYYYCEDEISDEQIYLTLKDGKWTDDEGLTGDYSISGNVVTLYIVIDNEKIEFMVGSVSGEDITIDVMGADVIYRKGDDLASKPKEKTLSYALSSDKSYYIVKGIGGLTGDIEIPDEYKRKPVKEISENAFANCKDITSIVIGNNLTTIGKKAFYNCANLTEAVLGKSVTTIPDNAFEGCSNLITITLGSDISRFGEKAFYSCRALKDIYFNGTVSDWAQIDFTSNPIYDNNIYIVGNNTATSQYPSRNLYIHGEILKDANITNAAYISKNAFLGYTQLENLTIGGMVSEIGDNAFYGCSALETLTVTGGVKTIGKASFRFCKKLSSVVLSDSVNIIGESAFDSCENLITVDTGNGVSYISYGAFMSCEKLSTLIIGNSVAEICEGAFYSCEALTTVTIPSSTIFIGKEAFSYTGLTSAIFKSTTGWVANKSDALTSEQLSDTSNAARLLITSILDKGYVEAEWEKPTLTYSLSSDKTYYIVNNSGTVSRSIIEIPEKYNDKPVRELAQNAFKDCKSLISLSLPGCMLNIPVNAFSGCTSLENITIRGYLVSSYEEVYASADGVLYNADFTQLIYMPLAKSEITLTGVKEIAESRFEYNKSLKKVTIGNGVESIGYRAFLGCENLTEITIPVSVTNIGQYAFNSCNNLKINYKGTLSDWCNLTINSKFPDGTELYINNEKVTNLVIPKEITKINDYGFSGISSITNVVLHSNLNEIGEQAFYECSSLAEITIPSTVEKIGRYAFGDCNALVIYCEISERPNEWSSSWGSNSNVIWDYKNNNVDQSGNIYIVVDGIRYALKDGVATVSKQMSEISRTVTIPANIKSKGINYKVTEIGSYAFERSSIKSIVLPDTITKIGQYAFNECAGLTKLTLANGLTDIGTCAFKNCAGITEIILPVSVKSIGSDSFSGCPVVKATVPTVAISYLDKDNLKTIIILSGKSVTGLKNCTTLTSVTLADGIEDIGNSAFYGCENLTNITLPDSVIRIGSEAFRGCINLTELKLSNSLTSIGANAFSGCVKLDNVIIPNSVSFIGNYAFSGCTNLAEIKLPDVAVTIGRDVFESTAYFADENNWHNGVLDIDKHLIIAHGLSGSFAVNAGTLSIAANAFDGNESLLSVILPESVGVIGSGAFMNCVELISVNIPDNVTVIASDTFNGCVKLENLTVSKNIMEIGNKAFAGCTALTCFVVPDGVTAISDSVFSGCSDLIGVTLPDVLKSIGRNAFYDCSSLKDITIPASVTSIGSGAFENCASITEIIIPEGVNRIEYDTFNSCDNLSNVTIPKSVKEISQTAFNACFALENVYFNGDIADWCDMSIHYYFANPLRYTKNFHIDGKLVENLVIPETVKEIKKYTFEDCAAFKSVTIPETVNKIGERAFQSVNCVIYCEAAQSPSGWDKDWAIYSDKIVWDYKNNDKDENGYSYIEVDGLKFAIKDGEVIVSTHSRNLKGEIVIPDSITYKNTNYKVIGIGENAFNGCSDITSVTMKTNIKSIYARAFAGCSSLVEITIPSSVEKIEYEVFNECTNLEKIYWNAISCERDDNYSNGTLGKCEKLTEVVFGNEVTAIGKNIFSNCKITTLTLPESLTHIGSYAFSGCNELQSITIPENVTYIGSNAFYYCNSLSEITLHNSITYLGYGAFSSTAYERDESNWQDGVLYIGKYLIKAQKSIEGSYEILDGTLFICEDAFYGCTKLSSVIIPDSLKAICDKAFYDCRSLTNITIPESVTQIGDSVFINSHISYINFKGTIAQLNVVDKGENWNRSGMGTILIECSDGYYYEDK